MRSADALVRVFIRPGQMAVGLSHTSLHRIEHGEHHLTLHKLETILTKLKLRLCDVFPEEF